MLTAKEVISILNDFVNAYGEKDVFLAKIKEIAANIELGQNLKYYAELVDQGKFLKKPEDKQRYDALCEEIKSLPNIDDFRDRQSAANRGLTNLILKEGHHGLARELGQASRAIGLLLDKIKVELLDQKLASKHEDLRPTSTDMIQSHIKKQDATMAKLMAEVAALKQTVVSLQATIEKNQQASLEQAATEEVTGRQTRSRTGGMFKK